MWKRSRGLNAFRMRSLFSGICTLLFIFLTTFTSLHSRKKITYFLLHFPWHPKVLVTFLMLSRTEQLSNSHTYQENIPGHPYCIWSGGLTKHKCFICTCVRECAPGYPYIYKTRKSFHLVWLIKGIWNDLYFYFWYLSIFITKYL